MPYTYQGWTLYSRDVKLKKGPKVTIYFFSKRKPKSAEPVPGALQSILQRSRCGTGMPEGTATFEVHAPIERVWAFVSDMRKIGGCVPGVQSVEMLDETRARWNLKVKIGPLSQDVVVLTETLEQVPMNHGKFRGQAENMDITGTIDLVPDGKATKVTYMMTVQAKGPLSRIMDNFMKSRLKAQTEEFATNVKKSLEG